jgi:hypothetical protein
MKKTNSKTKTRASRRAESPRSRIITLPTGEAVLSTAIVAIRMQGRISCAGILTAPFVLVDVPPHCICITCTDAAEQQKILTQIVADWKGPDANDAAGASC